MRPLDRGDVRSCGGFGARIGLTRERVRQIEHEAIGKLRDAMVVHA